MLYSPFEHEVAVELYEHEDKIYPRSLRVTHLLNQIYRVDVNRCWRFYKTDIPFVRSVYWILLSLPNILRKYIASQLPCTCDSECYLENSNRALESIVSRLKALKIPKRPLDSELEVADTVSIYLGSTGNSLRLTRPLPEYDFGILIEDLIKSISWYTRPIFYKRTESELLKLEKKLNQFLKNCHRVTAIFKACSYILGGVSDTGDTFRTYRDIADLFDSFYAFFAASRGINTFREVSIYWMHQDYHLKTCMNET